SGRRSGGGAERAGAAPRDRAAHHQRREPGPGMRPRRGAQQGAGSAHPRSHLEFIRVWRHQRGGGVREVRGLARSSLLAATACARYERALMALSPMERPLAEVDPDVARLIREETQRQAEGLELIASENFVSEAVLEAAGSTLTNKDAEGLPNKRYYGGCEVVDKVEQLAIDRAKALFGAEHANVQPHAGSQANMATYFALLRPGDRIMSLSLAQGGHLTHGSPVNFSGKL